MIKIEITDSHTMSEREIHNICTYLYASIGQVVAKAPHTDMTPEQLNAAVRAGDIVRGEVIDPSRIAASLKELHEAQVHRFAPAPIKPNTFINGKEIIPATPEELVDTLSKDIFSNGVADEKPPMPEHLNKYVEGQTVVFQSAHTNTAPPVPEWPNGLAAHEVNPALDSKGYPYDERIHSRGATRIKDGTWKLKKGVDMEEVIRLRNAYTPGQIPAGKQQVTIGEPITPVAEVPPPPPVEPVTGAPLDFSGMIELVGAALAERRVSQPQVLSICVELGLPSLPALQSRPDLFTKFHGRLMQTINEAAV